MGVCIQGGLAKAHICNKQSPWTPLWRNMQFPFLWQPLPFPALRAPCSPILNLGHLLPAPSCHTALSRLRCAAMKPRLYKNSSVPRRNASSQQRVVHFSCPTRTSAMGRWCHMPQAVRQGCGTRAGLSSSPGPCGTWLGPSQQPGCLPARPLTGSCPPDCLGSFQKMCSVNVTNGDPGEMGALIEACR